MNDAAPGETDSGGQSGQQVTPGQGHTFRRTDRAIREVWVWLHSVPTTRSEMDALARRLAGLHISDAIYSVNAAHRASPPPADDSTDSDFRVGAVPDMSAGTTAGDRVRQLYQALHGQGVALQLMAFLPPDQPFCRQAIQRLRALSSQVPFRSLQLDAESWWHIDFRRRRSLDATQRRDAYRAQSRRQSRATRAINTELTPWRTESSWPALGIGVTGYGSLAPRHLMRIANYGIPQMYASGRQYNNSRTRLGQMRNHYRDYWRRVGQPVANQQRVVVGMSAMATGSEQSRLPAPPVTTMEDVLRNAFRLNVPADSTAHVREIAFWSSDFLFNNSGSPTAVGTFVGRIAGQAVTTDGLRLRDV